MNGRILILLALVIPAAARGHEVRHTVERGRAVAVRAALEDGEPLADAAYEVFSPAAPAEPHQRGRTDRAGWLAFVPDGPGAWRVRVADRGGHGLDATVEVPAVGAIADPPVQQSSAAFVLRPIAGAALIGLVFFALALVRRKRPAR